MSMRASFVLALFLLPLDAFSTPTSEIPERREFPLSPSVNACTNFYEHVCSEAVNNFQLREDRSLHIFSFWDSHERLLTKKKNFLKEIDQKRGQKEKLPQRSQDLATLFGACMDGDARKKEETAEVQRLQRKLATVQTHADFHRLMREEDKAGKPSFVTVGSFTNLDESDKNDFAFFTSLMTLPERSYYLKKDVRRDYEQLLVDFFTTLGEKNPKAKARAILKLETDFAKIDPLPSEYREIFMQKSRIEKSDILKKYPSFAMEEYLARVPENTTIRHFVPKSYAFVDKTLRTAPLDDLKAAYLHYALAGILDDAYPEFFQKNFAFDKKHLGGPNERPSREERCTMRLMYDYGKEIDAELLPTIFPDFPEEKFIALAERVRTSILEGVKSNSWLSEQGRAGAIEKISKAKLQLVKPRNEEEWYFNPPADYDIKTPLANASALKVALQDRMFRELGEKRNRDRWLMGPLEINAYYTPDDNKFVMPVGILQYPFYDPKMSEEANLGAVGAVIGHELGHAIDDQGARMDADGKLRQWMTNKDVQTFKRLGRKLVHRFKRIGHDGQLTLGENIGDLTGVGFAFDAAFPKGQGTVDAKKDFFIGYGRVWCGVERPKFAEQMLKVDPHARNWARVNEQVKNHPDFAKTFGCKKGDKMFLDEKDIVRIW